MMGQEPKIVAVMRGEPPKHRDLVLLTDTARRTKQAVRVGGSGEHQRVARPCHQMLAQCGNRGVGLAREHQVEESDVAGLARRQTGGHVLGRRQGHARRRHVAFPHQYLGLAGLCHGKTRVRGDGAIKHLDRARIEG